MTEIIVRTDVPYAVTVGGGVSRRLPELIRCADGAGTFALVSDDTVIGLYGDRVTALLEKTGKRVVPYVFPHGEGSKNGSEFLGILDFLARSSLTRDDYVVALGGGVTGDLAGFAASAYMRGIGFIQIPTTLLAAVDSSVGGKTAIDLPSGKNLAGSFYQPSAVICDTDFLDTLPPEVFSDGCAEVIKYGVLGNEKLLRHVTEKGTEFDREYVISECVRMKADIVSADEREHGVRTLLNLGHTLAHAIEKVSGYSVSHGRAVAAGLAVVSRGAEKLGYAEAGTAEAVENALRAVGLPTGCPDELQADELFRTMCHDKKRRGDKTLAVIPKKIGRCEIVPLTDGELRRLMTEGM